MNKTEIKLAIIGCGRRAPAGPATLKAVPNAKLVALCDLVGPRVKAIKKLAGDDSIREYTDHRKMLVDGGFDGVMIYTEPEYQAALACEAMEAGYDVFSEVPASYSLDDCWKLVVTAERTGRTYYLGEQMRHSSLIRWWRQMLLDGYFGSVLFAEGHYIHAMAYDRFWRDPETGELLTWEQAAKTDKKVKTRMWTLKHPILYGPHEISPLLKVLDDRVASVSCYSTGCPNKRLKEVPFPCQFEEFPNADMEVALMHTEKGRIIRFAANFTTPLSESHWWHILGTKGEVETRRGPAETGYFYYHPAPVILDGSRAFARTPKSWFFGNGKPAMDQAVGAEIEQKLEMGLPPHLRKSSASGSTGHGGIDFYPIADFVNCVRDKDAKPDIDVYRAVETAAPCILAARSAEQGGANLTVPDFRPGKNRKKGEMPALGQN